MPSLTALLSKWPLVRQIRERKDGTGARVDVGQDARDAREDRRRESGALDLPILRRRLRSVRLSQGRETDFDRGRPGESDQPGESLSERRGILSIAHPFAARNESEISRAAREAMDGDFARSRDGHGGGARLGIAQAHFHSQTENGATINHTTAICHLGGATLDNEENYLIKKLFTGGLGMVCVSNQARI